MPLKFRRLPAKVTNILESSSLPDNVVMFNPSVAYPIMYLRTCSMTNSADKNSIVFHNLQEKTTHVVKSDNVLLPSVNLYQGLEDVRIVWYNDKLWFTATSTHASISMMSETLVGYFDSELKAIERVARVDLGKPPIKNITPFVHEGKLKLLDIEKGRVYVVEDILDNDGNWVGFAAPVDIVLKPGAGVCIDGLRTSTSPVHLHGNLWGCIAHDCIYYDNTKITSKLSYLHYWVEFDIRTGSITFVSSPFWIVQWGIEFVSGVYLNPAGSVVLYIGVNDNKPIMATTTLGDLRIGK